VSYRPTLAVIAALIASGCAQTRVVERPVPVEVVRVEYVPIPAECRAPCPPDPQPVRQGDPAGRLVDAYRAQQAIIACLRARLECIEKATAKPPPQ